MTNPTRTSARYLLTCLLLALQGCAAQVDPEPTPVHPVITLGYVACTTVTDTVPSDDCAPGQTSVTRCSQPDDSPDPNRCTGPVGFELQERGDVWCCLPVDTGTVRP